jgi:hypothetical protein
MQDASNLSGCLSFNVLNAESIAKEFKRRGIVLVLPDGREVKLKVTQSAESQGDENAELTLACEVI